MDGTPAYLRQKADHCRTQADNAVTGDERAKWLEMANLFVSQAEILAASANNID